MSNGKHLTPEKRYHIELCLKRGMSQCEIAQEIEVHESTLSREIKRNTGQRGYRHKQAQRKADERKGNNNKLRISAACYREVEEKLKQGHSPEQISERRKKEGKESISHEQIYLHIYMDKAKGGDLHTYLMRKKKYRKRKGAGRDCRGQIRDRVGIDKRPAVVDELSRIGDWEVDTVVGSAHKGVFVTMHERRSAIYLSRVVAQNKADLVADAIIDALKPYREYVHTITADNGREFAHHKKVAQALQCKFYFARPYHSWERGRNENSNGRLRRFFPKGTSLAHITQQMLDEAVEKMVNTPRKLLNYDTPREYFLEETGIWISNSSDLAFIC